MNNKGPLSNSIALFKAHTEVTFKSRSFLLVRVAHSHVQLENEHNLHGELLPYRKNSDCADSQCNNYSFFFNLCSDKKTNTFVKICFSLKKL